MKSFAIEWMLALPLYHLLIGKTQLFDKENLNFEIDHNYYNDKLGLDDMKVKANKERQ